MTFSVKLKLCFILNTKQKYKTKLIRRNTIFEFLIKVSKIGNFSQLRSHNKTLLSHIIWFLVLLVVKVKHR